MRVSPESVPFSLRGAKSVEGGFGIDLPLTGTPGIELPIYCFTIRPSALTFYGRDQRRS